MAGAVCALSAFLLPSPAFADPLTVRVVPSRAAVYIGESFDLNILVSGGELQAPPDLSGMTNCAVRYLGDRTESRFSYTIVNGRPKKEGFSGRIFTYNITPTTSGVFRTGPVVIRKDSSTMSAFGPDIQVEGVTMQDYVRIAIRPTMNPAVPNDRFEVEMTILLKALPGNMAAAEPLDPANPPHLSVPFFEQNALPGLQSQDLVTYLNGRLVGNPNQPGFEINDYRMRGTSIFSDFLDKRPARFTFDRDSVEINGVKYHQYRTSLKYTAKDEGTYTFGPVEFKGNIVVPESGGKPVLRRILAIGPAATVRVVPPPEHGRPTSYIGATGTNLVVDASIAPQTCNVGDPILLTVTLTTDAPLENVYPPPLALQTNILQHFRIQDTPRSSTTENGKVFIYTIRPLVSGTLDFPPVEASYFDIATRSYRTVATRHIPVRANPAQDITGEHIVMAATGTTSVVLSSRLSDTAVAPVDVSPYGADATPMEFRSVHLAAVVAPPLLFLALWSALAVASKRRSSAERRRQIRAGHQCISGLRDLKTFQPANACDGWNQLGLLLKEYTGTRFGAHAAAITPSEARGLLLAAGVPSELASDLARSLERCVDVGFAGVSPEITSLVETVSRAMTTVEAIESFLKTRDGKEL